MKKSIEIDDEIINEINAKLKKTKTICLISGIFVVVIAVLLGIFVDIMLGVMLGIAFLTFVFAIPCYKKTRLLKKHIVPLAVKKAFGRNAVYNAYGNKLGKEFFKKMNLFPTPHISTEDYIRATYKNVEFACCDVESYEIINTKDGEERRILFSGMAFTCEFNKPFDGEVIIKEKDYASAGKVGIGLEQFQTESIEFNESYKGYATTKHTGFYVITPQLIERLNKIRRIIKGGFCFKFTSDRLYIAISGAKNELEGKGIKTLDKKSLDILVAELEPIKILMEELALDKTYFKDVKEIIEEKGKEVKDKKKESDEHDTTQDAVLLTID